MAIVFDGRAFAKEKEKKLRLEVEKLRERGVSFRVKTFVFREDEGSRLYAGLKQKAAQRIGIVYEPVMCSLDDDVEKIAQEIVQASADPTITGVMVQKPQKTIFNNQFSISNEATTFKQWWEKLTSAIDPKKDVDCLTRENLSRIHNGRQRVLPATVRAVLSILEDAKRGLDIEDHAWREKRVAILGRSDIVGLPLSWVLGRRHAHVSLFGKSDAPSDFSVFDIVISAVGKENLVTGGALKDGSIVVDVGSPKGDVQFSLAVEKAAFITPVPGGVGPVTVVSLMENVVELASKREHAYG